ncbi:sulfurtransferase [Peribacillus sp. SI8-4]|uniref:sulfurtransferase n=1 Tax=Peribacillus sp. SI8-4 TaxID=3048009 RepID=UPI00255686C4|nr:sulfurtransferase [Peribacillus sp. SI8-4]
MSLLINKEELLPLLTSNDIRICDCRFRLGSPDAGQREFNEDHIPGAVYFDLEKDLSGKVQVHGGRHPLPDLTAFKGRLEAYGITNDTVLVAYDGGEGSFASRFVWLLGYLGHRKVHVLDGGYTAWKEAGYPIDAAHSYYPAAKYHIEINASVFASYQEVKQFTLKKPNNIVLVDSREPKRFLGIEEPIDKKAGHIPGAVNKLWTKALDDGHFKTKEELMNNFSDIDSDKEIIVYCGSGVTASPNYVALKEAGYEQVKVYIGSFSDWISYDGNPVD